MSIVPGQLIKNSMTFFRVHLIKNSLKYYWSQGFLSQKEQLKTSVVCNVIFPSQSIPSSITQMGDGLCGMSGRLVHVIVMGAW